ncbi:hypothetical protein [Labrys neptuniae]|uniref:Lipoprotein n=1 Tax=Labrys neptuniae TaxID=376174 RepID=A0ABV3PL42_9HYPH
MKNIAIVGSLAFTLSGCTTLGVMQANETIPAGRIRKVDFYSALHEDCSSMGEPTVRISQQPQHGHLEIKPGKDYSRFTKTNPRNVCNKMPTQSAQLWYKPDSGYTGTDTFSVLIIYPDNGTRSRNYTIHVI